MTGQWVYPRLGLGATHLLLDRLRAADLAPALRCADAVAPPTGALVTEQILDSIRHAALDAVADLPPGDVSRTDAARWDAAVGTALHQSMGIVPADAANEGVWSFITLVLLPDLAAARFPELHADRIIGRPRNVFRRVWWRREVLGDLPVPQGTRPLGEDEYVNIFERSNMARNRSLARALALAILRYDGPDRSEFTRELAKNVRRLSGPVLLDALSESQIAGIVDGEMQRLVT